MSDTPASDWAQRFIDRQLEADFRAHQDQVLARTCRPNLVTGVLTWLAAELVIAFLAREQLVVMTALLGALYFPPQVASIWLAPRATSPRQLALLGWLLYAADVGSLVTIIIIAQVRMGSTLLALAALLIQMFDDAVVNTRRTAQASSIVIAIAASYQVALVLELGRGAAQPGSLWIPTFAIWLAALQCLTLIRAADQRLRQTFLQARTIAAQHEQIREEKARSERLLLNVLPESIAQKLKEREETIAEEVPEASVLFADLAGFTSMSAGMTAAQVVEMLNEVFSCFDGLVEKHRLEKIKTIGDCYMVASGVPQPRADHATALIALALDMREAVASRAFAGKKLAFRFGVSSGPVVAGVIGRRKFIYDLWGDTVNVASRMESHGHAATVQITERTHALVSRDFTCEPKGALTVKGKGEMNVWHVTGRQGA